MSLEHQKTSGAGWYCVTVGGLPDPRLAGLGPEWCTCEDAPWFARSAATLLDHSIDCGYPNETCRIPGHRRFVHGKCGRPMPMRFCGCGATGFTFDEARGWWVHYECGWPTRAWFSSCGELPPADLLGVRPAAYHEFVVVPQNPKATYERLSEEQRRINEAWAGGWVRD